MKKNRLNLKIGDSVMVNTGVKDPDSGIEIGGWQGRIRELEEDEHGHTVLCVSWDSLTLRDMPKPYVEESEVAGFDWQNYYLGVEDVTPVQSRDSQHDVTRAVDEMARNVGWSSLGEEGRRIQQVLAGIDDEWEAFRAWEKYLHESLSFPFKAQVSEPQESERLREGDKVTVVNISGLDDLYGIITGIRHGAEELDVPLCDLEVVEKNSSNKEVVRDYAVWYANR